MQVNGASRDEGRPGYAFGGKWGETAPVSADNDLDALREIEMRGQFRAALARGKFGIDTLSLWEPMGRCRNGETAGAASSE